MLLIIYFDVFWKHLVKRLDENGIKYHIVKYDDLSTYLQTHSTPTKVIITGSKKRVMRENDFPLLETLMKMNVKIIGICFGFQYLALKSGGKVIESEHFIGTRTAEKLHFNHYDRVVQLPKPWKIISNLENFINIAKTNKWIGFQFHPEKTSTHFSKYVLPLL